MTADVPTASALIDEMLRRSSVVTMLIRRGIVTIDPAEAEQCCGLDRDDDGFCSIKPRHPIYVGGTA